MNRRIGLLAVVMGVGLATGNSALAGQLNALGQWTPTSTQEALSLQDERIGTGLLVPRSVEERQDVGAARRDRDIRYRLDALGREVPIQTNLP